MTHSTELPFISVVVPTRNRASLLNSCLASLSNQGYRKDRYEIIVVDDGSTDGTEELVANTGSQAGPVVVYTRLAGLGLNAARNAGIETGHGEIVLLADDDVIAPPGWIDSFVNGSRRHPYAGCFGGPVRLKLEGPAPRMCHRETLDGELELGGSERVVGFVGGGNMAVRREIIESVGLFDERLSGFGDDAEWETRLTQSGGSIVYLPEAWLWHCRTKADLAKWNMLRKGFRRGRERVAYAGLVRQPIAVSAELKGLLRFLGHGVLRFCFGGFASATGRAGTLWELALRRGVHSKGRLPSAAGSGI